jgi:hypothetical protein
MVDKKPDHWIFIARREGGDLEEIQRVIDMGIWDFVSREGDPKTPQFHDELKAGDFVLFYLDVTYPDRKKIEGGRSIIGKARLGSPYIFYGKYFGNDVRERFFVFLLDRYKINKEIEPLDYRIGSHPGQMVVKISKKDYDSIVG